MKNKWVIWAVVAVALVGVVFLLTRPTSDAGKGVVDVDSDKVQQLVDSGDARIIDVRTAGEYEAGHLKNAENVPVDQLAGAAQTWDRAEPLLVYCATGSRSSSAVQQLESMDFETVYHFPQGLVAWQGDLDTGAGQPVAQSEPVQTGGKPVMYEFFTDW